MTYAVLCVRTNFDLLVNDVSLSAPDSVKNRITETLRHNNKFAHWNDNQLSLLPGDRDTLQLYSLLNWIEASGWVIVQMSCEQEGTYSNYRHTYIFKQN